MARRTKEDAEKTRESLLDAAETVFLRKGVNRSSLEEIAKEAGVTRGAIYWHFANKLAIIRAMHNRVKQPITLLFEELTSGDEPLRGLKATCVHVFNLIETDQHARNTFTIMRLRSEDHLCDDSEESREMWDKRQEALEKFTRVFRQIDKKHPLAEGMTPELAATALHAFISGIFWDFLTARGPYPMHTITPLLVDRFFAGLLQTPA